LLEGLPDNARPSEDRTVQIGHGLLRKVVRQDRSLEETNRTAMPEALWKEDDVIDGQRARAMVLILRTSGCWWSKKLGCLMCGYNLASREGIGTEHIIAQLQNAVGKYQGEEMVKIYTSGSFLDPKEIPLDARDQVISAFAPAKRILFESRPEFVVPEVLDSLPKEKVEIALGLESSNDDVLRKCVRKGFRVFDYVQAAQAIRDQGMRLRTYLLLKPPFMSERQGMLDTIASVKFSSQHSQTISVNPVNVQAGTEVERLWKRGNYRPPWLWSLVEVLKEAKRSTEVRVFSSPSGAGTSRGVHNCERCDQEVLQAVKRFAFSQDLKEFDGLDCACRREWEAQLRTQDAMMTSVDIERYLENELPLV